MSRCLAALLLPLLLAFGTNGEEECHLGAIDLVFVMDESKSVGADNYLIGLNAAVDLTKALTIGTGANNSRVGFVLFGNSAEMGFKLTDYTNNADVATAIKAQHFGGGGTNIADGMDFAIRQVFVPAPPKGVPKIMLIITDGRDSTDVHTEHVLAWENDIIVYALGVGTDIDTIELYNATGNMNNIYSVNEYSGLAGAMRNICKNIEPVAPTSPPPVVKNGRSCNCEKENLEDNKYWLDVIFVVDSSSGVSGSDFVTIKELLMMMTYLNLQTKPGSENTQDSRMAIINTAEKATDFLTLNSSMTSTQINSLIRNNLTQQGGFRFDPQAGLQRAYDMIMEQKAAGRRENVRKAVVMFSTAAIDCHRQNMRANPNETDVLCELVSVMEDDSTTLISIGLRLAGEGDFPYIDIVNKCNALDNTVNMIENVLTALCRANCYCLEPYTQFAIGEDGCEKFGECVYAEELSLPYHSAKATCADQGNTLSTSYSKEKDEFLQDLHLTAGFYPYWVGMTCPGGVCVGDDDKPLADANFSNWCTLKSQPNFAAGECVYQGTCDKFVPGWFTAKCGNFMPDYYFSCQSDACSVNHFCRDPNKPQKISTRKVTKRKNRSSLLYNKISRRH